MLFFIIFLLALFFLKMYLVIRLLKFIIRRTQTAK